jgi:hypothetical protein
MAFLVGSCDLLEGDFLTSAGQSSSAGNSSDPAVQAVQVAGDAISKIEQADKQLEKGLQAHDVNLIKDAARQRPYDPKYGFYQEAMEIALDLEDRGGRERSDDALKGLYFRRRQNGLPLSTHDYNKDFVDALWETKSHFPPDSVEAKRLRDHYCFYLKEYERQFNKPLEKPRLNCP